ncbi:MAG: enoyl-CoA hydratase/isomerase family protein [Chloroflexi bacterium]|nr:enoyl-CoA hydratase/isomerase family protein [Chloroflexota bacterium]
MELPYETVIYEKKGRIAYITLNRPERLNAFNTKMRLELTEIWQNFEKDDNLWVAIVTGAGNRAMCSGADVRDAADRKARGEYYTIQAKVGEVTPYRWGPRTHNVTKPVIAAVNGICCGGGLDFVTESDIAICSENATFFDPHVSIGWVSAHEMIQMSRRIPLGICLRMALMGVHERMDAKRAYELGLVSEMMPQERLMARATEIAEIICRNAPLAVRGTKLGILRGLGLSLDEAETKGHVYLRQVEVTEDHDEGPRAFAEKRAPQWKGK